jgi:hypothetical protein
MTLDDRDVRALTEYMTVLESSPTLPDAPGMYAVVSASGSEYHVDARHSRCECDDSEYRDVRCKHIRRVEYETGRCPLPAWIDSDDLPQDFALHVDGGPIQAGNSELQARVDAVHAEGEVLE